MKLPTLNPTRTRQRAWLRSAFLALTIVGLSWQAVMAQLPMTRSSFSGTYTPISVGGGATAVAVVTGDDQTATNQPIGFSFNYLGTPYTAVAICNSGWISFNAASTSTSFTNLEMYSTTGPQLALFPYFDDFNPTLASVNGNPRQVLYQTQGSAPNRTYTVQWTDFNSFRTAGGTALNFQVVLYETTNVIEFRYASKTNGTYITGQSASIGIEGATGGPGNFMDALTGSSRTGHHYLSESQWPTVFFRFTPGAPAVLAGGTYNVGVGQTYNTLTDALADVQQRGISGAVTLNLVDAVYDTVATAQNFFPLLVGPVTGTSAVNTITVTKTGSPATIRWGGNIGGSTGGAMVNGVPANINASNVEPIIGLCGADFMTWNNIDVRGNIGFQNADHAIGVYNNTATDGSQNNTFSNFSVINRRANTGSRGVVMNVTTAATSAAGANSNNTFRDFSITNCYAGIQLAGTAGFPDLNTQITRTNCATYNTIGDPATANDIGNGTAATFGISASNQAGFTISNNSIRNVTNTGGQADGINVLLYQSNGVTPSTVANNFIRGIRNTGTASTTAIAGLRITHTTTGTHAIRIYNNAISEIISGYTGAATATRVPTGIFLASTAGTNTQTYEIWNNSVSINGSASPNISNACLASTNAITGPVITANNNIFANYTSAQTGVARHYGVHHTINATQIANTGTIFRNNNIFIQNDANVSGFTAAGTTTPTNYNGVAAWQGAVAQASNNLELDPQFADIVSSLVPAQAGLNGAAFAPPGYLTADINCATRTPDNDIGAFIIVSCVTPVAGTITGNATMCEGTTNTLTAPGSSTGLGISYQWKYRVNGSSDPFTNLGTTGSQSTSGLLPGIWEVVLDVTCSAGPSTVSSGSFVLTVNDVPSASASSNSPACVGQALNLIGTTDAGTTFSWTGPNAFTSTEQSPQVSASATLAMAGTYSFTATLAGCTSPVQTTTVVVNPSPTVTIDPAVVALCPSASATLTALGTHPLATVRSSLVSNAATILASIPTPSGFTDGNTGTSIADGCNDMYDTGNILNTNIATSIPYTNGVVTPSASFGTGGSYFTQVIGSNLCGTSATAFFWVGEINGLTNVSITGNLGADGTGSQNSTSFNITANGVTYTAFVSRVFGATDPSINHIFLVPQPNSASQTINGDTQNENHVITGLSGVTRFYYMLFAGASAVQYTDPQVTAVAQAFANALPSTAGITYLWAPGGETTDAISVSTAGTYTVTATAGGCSSQATRNVTVATTLSSATITPASPAYCAGGSVTLTATPDNGSPPYTYQWVRPDLTLAGTNQTQVADAPGVWTVNITDNCGTVANGLPSPTVVEYATPTAAAQAGPACLGQQLDLTGITDIGVLFSWTGPNAFASGLQNPSIPAITAAAGGTYTFTTTGPAPGNCVSAPSTVSVTVNTPPTITVPADADPNPICSGGTTQLSVTATAPGYTVAPIAFAPVTPGGPTTAGPAGDDLLSAAIPIGFPFTFYGVSYTNLHISTNGFVGFTNDGDAGCCSGDLMPITGNFQPNNVIALAWEDLNTNNGGNIDYFNLTSPNRFVVRWNNVVRHLNTGATDGQIILYDNGVIEMHIINSNTTGGDIITQGVENATGTAATTVPGRNATSWSVTNDGQRFTPAAPAYLWDNASLLNDATLANPIASNVLGQTTFEVTATNAGCSVTSSVVVNVDPPPTASLDSLIQDCDNNEFSLDFDITSTGTGTTAGLSWTVDGVPGMGSPITGLALNASQLIGPFSDSTEVVVTILHENLSICDRVVGTYFSGCPIIIDCGETLEETFCYGNNEAQTFFYLSPIDGETVTISFVSGSIGLNDAVNFYTGSNNLGTPIAGGNFGGNLAGQVFTSSTDSIFFEIISNDTTSCESGQFAGNPWVFEVECTPGCTEPTVIFDPVLDCDNSEFSLDGLILDLGDSGPVDIVYNDGVNPNDTVFDVDAFVNTLIGPFPLGSTIAITLLHSTDPLCNETVTPITVNFSACPNDEACDARLAPVNPNYTCVSTVPGTISGASASPEPNACGGTPNFDTWYRFVATATVHRAQLLSVFPGSVNMTMAGFTEPCASPVAIAGACSTTGTLNMTGLTVGDTILVRVFNTNGAAGSATFQFCASAPPLVDVGATSLAEPVTTGCYSPAENVDIVVTNLAIYPLDLSVEPVTVTTNVTGAVVASLSGTANSGVIAPGATFTVTMSSTLNMSTAGVYTFNASATSANDGIAANAAMTAANRTVIAPVALPQANNFTGFTGANLTTVFPNWREATGATVPTGTTSSWLASTLFATQPTARINLVGATKREWIVGPKFVPVIGTKLDYKVALTDAASLAADPVAMQGTDDAVAVMISTNCGVSYSPISVYNALTTNGVVSNSLLQQSIDLSAYAGQEVIIAFFATEGTVDNTPSYDFHLEDININNVPACTGTPTAGAITMLSAGPYCEPANVTLQNLTASTDGGITHDWYASLTSGGPYIQQNVFTNTVIFTGVPDGTYYLVDSVRCLGSGLAAGTAEFSFTVNPTPTATPTSNGPLCAGAPALNLTGGTDIGTTFAWTGPNSFTSTEQNPSIVNPTTAAAGTYTFTATAGGCSATGTVAVVINPNPVIVSATATPSTICDNGTATSQFNVTSPAPGYAMGAGGTSFIDISATGTDVPGALFDDSEHNITMPSFIFNGVAYTTARVAVNGSFFFGSTTGESALTQATLPSGAHSAGNIFLVPWWDDLDVQSAPTIRTQTVGNKFIVQWTNMEHNDIGTGANGITFQVQMDLVTGAIHYVYSDVLFGNATFDAAASATVGLQWANSAGNAIQYSFSTASLTNGQVISFTPNANAFSWSPGTLLSASNIANPVFGPATTGTYPYTVTATNTATSCSSTATVSVTSNPSLSAGQANITPASPFFCGTGTVTLTANPLGGGGPYTYAWTDPNNAAAGTNQTVAAGIIGTWSVLITDACGGSASANTNVTQNPVPTASASAGPGCLGANLNLTGTTNIGTSYAWSGPNGFTSTEQNPVIANATAAAAGTYTFTATAAGCPSLPATVGVSMNAPPTLATPASATPAAVCEGSNSQLNVSMTASGYLLGSGGATFIDISGSGTPVPSVPNTLGDDSEHAITLPGFTFNGVNYTSALVGNNGAIVLGVSTGTISFSNAALPGTFGGAGTVGLAPWWDDLDVVTGTTQIFTQQVGNVFIIQYNNMDHDDLNPGADFVTFQVQLDLTTGVIYYLYQDVSFADPGFTDNGQSATVGIQWANSAGNFVQYSFNTASLSNGQVISFTPNSASYSWSPATFLSSTTIANPVATAVNADVTYTVTGTNVAGCTTQSTVSVTVIELPVVDAGSYGTVCGLDAADVPLVGTPAGGTFTGTGVSGPIGSQVFDPSVGTQTLTYTYFDGSCSNNDQVIITVDVTDTDGDGTPDCADSCPTVFGQVGDFCDSDPGGGIAPGVLDGTCTCVAIPCTENVVVDLRTDLNSQQASFQILADGTNQVLCQGGIGPAFPPNVTSPILVNCCLPAGCFRLVVSDSGGDGFVTGGYQLREQGVNGRRIIDNFGNFTTGNTSAISTAVDGGVFCLPIGNDKLIFNTCDKLDWVNFQYLVAQENVTVSAEWVPNGANSVQDANSGYEFWIYDPNGSYSFRRFRSHNVSDGFSPANATRACHMKINNWTNTVLTPHIPANALMNVRVRGRVNGAPVGEFGPACLMKIDAARAACPLVWLQDNPANAADFSCGVTKNFGGTNSSANRVVARPPQFQPPPLAGGTALRYQFRFRIPGENICIVRPPQTSATLHLNWTTGQQLECTKTYLVEVRVSKDGGATWCVDAPSPSCVEPVTQWGRVCSVTIATSTFCPGPLDGGSSSLAGEGNGGLTMYPNPNRGDQVILNLSEVAEDVLTINVDIYDLSGKRVVARTIAVQDGFVNTALELNGDLAGGMYMVNVTAGDKTYTERLVIQP